MRVNSREVSCLRGLRERVEKVKDATTAGRTTYLQIITLAGKWQLGTEPGLPAAFPGGRQMI